MPFETDDWDVGDFGIVFLNARFNIPRWMLKLYPLLNIYNRFRYNSIIFRVAGHQIKTTKAIDRCDAVIFDRHHNSLQIPAFYMSDLPKLNIKRYNCEAVYSPSRQTLVAIGGSGIDKKQINSVEFFNMSDKYVIKDQFYDEYSAWYDANDSGDEGMDEFDAEMDELEAKDENENGNESGLQSIYGMSGSSSSNISKSNASGSSLKGGLVRNDALKSAELKQTSMRKVLAGTPPDANIYRKESRKELLNKFRLEWIRNNKIIQNLVEPKEDMSTILFSDRNNRNRFVLFDFCCFFAFFE